MLINAKLFKLAPLVSALLLFVAVPLHAEDAKPFTDAKEINLVDLLKPPPALHSPEMQAELAEILNLQVTRSKAMEERAAADAEENIWRFSDAVNNPAFTKEKLPKFAAFFDRIVETEDAVTDPYKAVWKRPRPHLYSDLVKPCVPLSKSGSYPSGHTTLGTLMGIVLSDMLPEKRDIIMARAWEYGENRLIGGIHYESDIEAGRISGTVIAQVILEHEDYKTEFAAAKTELRVALGM